MIKYTYLEIDLLSLFVPLVFSFHPRVRLYKKWKALLPSIIIVAIGYIIWDSFFSWLGIWGFNPVYLTGFTVGNLPIEELMFFFCIPYACVFTFECVAPVIRPVSPRGRIKYINYVFTFTLIVMALIFRAKPYTVSALTLLALMILIAELFKINWLGKFYVVYIILLVPFLIVNGILTGTGLSSPVVWYSPAGIIGVRIMTIPIEDIFYGMGLILANVWLYLALQPQNRPKRFTTF